MKQLTLIEIKRHGLLEYIRERLRGLEYRQMERDARRARRQMLRRRRRNPPPAHPTLFDQEAQV